MLKNKADQHPTTRTKPRRKWNKTGLHCQIDLNALDKRTNLGKMALSLKEQLRAYVEEPTITTELLTHRIIYKALKLSMYEITCLKNPKNDESPYYLPMANSLRLDLQALSQMVGEAKSKVPTLKQIISDYEAIKNET